jgi:hypothetical protein
VVVRRKISGFLESLARPHVATDELSQPYKAMVQDKAREQEALSWSKAEPKQVDRILNLQLGVKFNILVLN